MNSEGTRATSSTWTEGQTRYRHGKSGSPASSRCGGRSLDVHFDSSCFGKAAATGGPSCNEKRWQRRTSTALKMEKSTSGWSTTVGGGEGSCFSKLFSAPALPRCFRAGAMPVKNKTSSSFSSAMDAADFVFPTREDHHAVPSEILWSVGGTNKRGTVRKDRRNGKSSMCLSSIGRSRTRVATTRSTPFLCNVNDDKEGRVSDGGANPFAFDMQQNTSSRGSGRISASLTLSTRNERVDECAAADTCHFDVNKKLLRVRPSASSSTLPSVASVGSTIPSCDLQSFLTVDPLVVRARAVLQDCIRTRRMEQNNARKRSIEGCFGGSQLESKWYSWHNDSFLKPVVECGIASPRSSCSSDDELRQFSLTDQPLCSEKSARDCDSKLAEEEMYRQILVGDYDLSSSPEFRSFSPLFEEKGLPIEVRYQLPLALCTANETRKECAICQLYYGIGDHIVTLPCQHFFHACCVDKWLWDHTSCPLCRTDVTLDQMMEALSTTHNFTECSPMDQERIRRQMRSSSRHAGFRSVVPVKDDDFELTVSRMTIDGDSEGEDELSGLICPTPRFATNVQDK